MGFGIVLGALNKPPYEPLQEASLKHITYKTVFVLPMAWARRRSELQALVFNPKYIQLKPQGEGVTLYFSPDSCVRIRKLHVDELMTPSTVQQSLLRSLNLALLTVQ